MAKAQASPWSTQAFNELREKWYEKLSQDGFTDIERIKDDTLEEWHSFKFVSITSQIRREKRSQYQLQIDCFANDPQFHEVLRLIVKHGNSKFTVRQIEYIWTMHRDGVTERGIAREMRCSQSCVHFLLKRMREWMKLIS